jgi:hypothetical protein
MQNAAENSVLEEPVCPHCICPISGEHHFCPHCNAPLTAFATSGPYEQVLSQGYAVRAGVTRPANVVVLVGMWLIFAPTGLVAFLSAAGFLLAWGEGLEQHAVVRLVGMIGSAFWFLLATAILWKSTRNFLRAPQAESKEGR